MRACRLFSALVLFSAGCLSSMTKRLDTTNAQLRETNQHLAAINEMTREANAKMIEMNQHLLTTNEQLIQTNRRLEAIEKRFPRLPLLGAAESPPSPAQKSPVAVE